MSHSTAVAATMPVAPARSRRSFFPARALTTAAFLCLWLEIIQQLRSEWTLNPQYAYGWTVPFLAACIFAQRWRNKPAPNDASFPRLTITLVVTAAAILFPARLVAVANPDWRLLDWTFAVAAVVISLGAIELSGGASWGRHFAFPILFFLVAVPWPVQLEQFVVQNLMRADAAIAMQILNFTGTSRSAARQRDRARQRPGGHRRRLHRHSLASGDHHGRAFPRGILSPNEKPARVAGRRRRTARVRLQHRAHSFSLRSRRQLRAQLHLALARSRWLHCSVHLPFFTLGNDLAAQGARHCDAAQHRA